MEIISKGEIKMVETNEAVTPVVEEKPVAPPRPRKPVERLTPMKIANCARVNLREEPDQYAEVVKILGKDEIVKVDKSFKHEKFSKVKTNDADGYVMTNYLATL